MARSIPKGAQFWPDDAHDLHPSKLIEMYENGFAGAWHDDVAAGEFQDFIRAGGGEVDGDKVASQFGLAGTFAGKLVLPYRAVEALYPNNWPGVPQQCGDCVSHATRTAALLTMCAEIAFTVPNDSGSIPGKPDVPDEGIRNGTMSSEAFYWFRGYNGDGWSCQAAAQVALHQSGLWMRKPYPEVGVDFTRYSGSQAHRYGRRSPPENFSQEGRTRVLTTATEISGPEMLRDFLGNGHGVSSCGSEGFSPQRDENGVSHRRGSWSHGYPILGFDDRDCIKKLYGEPLVLNGNNWGAWNSGSRKIYETDLQIPEGSWWSKWSDVRNRYYVAFAGATGWSKKLPAYQSVLG